MIVSRNEIESLALKAARGAGLSWGLAEEASIAAGWLAEHALPWADTLVGVLAQAHGTSAPQVVGPRIAPSHPGTRLCPIRTGALLSDLGPPASDMDVRDLLAPLWLVPFLASWAGPDRGVRLGWGAARLLVGQGDVTGANVAPAGALSTTFAENVTIALQPIDRSRQVLPRRERSGYVAPDDAWRVLQEFEHRSYVPTTAQSRLAGAGAGLLDND
jgi:Protein of unknown function (DUF3726)